MQSFKQHTRRVALVVVALALGGVTSSAFAATTDTNYDISITNKASVNYSVSGVPQTVIRSAPGAGNSIPGSGGGADTTFKVDKKIMFLAEEIGLAPSYTSPNLNNVVTVFRVTNTSNGAQDFRLEPTNPSTTPPVIFGNADNANMNNLRARVSNQACTVGGPGSAPAYGGETADYINQLGEDACKYVFILADTPNLANNSYATVLLTVKPSVATTNGGTVEGPTLLADDPAVVEAVYAESGTADGNAVRDGISFAYDQYIVGTLLVTKTAAVISDGFTLNPAFAKAIPGAIVEYTISVQNNGPDTTASTLTEVIPTNTAYVAGSTTLNGVAVADVAGVMPYVNPGAISSPGSGAGIIIRGSAAAQIAVVKFRVTIQ